MKKRLKRSPVLKVFLYDFGPIIIFTNGFNLTHINDCVLEMDAKKNSHVINANAALILCYLVFYANMLQIVFLQLIE